MSKPISNLTLNVYFNELSKKYNLQPHVIEEIWNSQWRGVKELIINKKVTCNIRTPYFGSFTTINVKKNTIISQKEHDRLLQLIMNDDSIIHDSIVMLGKFDVDGIKYQRPVKFNKDENGNWIINKRFKVE